MGADELEAWLATPESRKVGWKGADGTARESVGHASGRRIVAISAPPRPISTTPIMRICGKWSAMSAATARRSRPI